MNFRRHNKNRQTYELKPRKNYGHRPRHLDRHRLHRRGVVSIPQILRASAGSGGGVVGVEQRQEREGRSVQKCEDHRGRDREGVFI